MQIFYALFGILVSAIAIAGRVFFWSAGRTKERLKSEQRNNEALREEIDRLNAKPVTHNDRMRLFERAKTRAKAREETKP